jgi:hypothetical protein
MMREKKPVASICHGVSLSRGFVGAHTLTHTHSRRSLVAGQRKSAAWPYSHLLRGKFKSTATGIKAIDVIHDSLF